MRSELRAMLRIAGPVILGEIGWMAMGLVDTLYVGPLGPAAIAAVGVSSGVFTAIAIFGMGLMLGLDTLVSHAWGARRPDECLDWLRHGTTLALLVAPAAMLLTWLAVSTMGTWHLNPDIDRLARDRKSTRLNSSH